MPGAPRALERRRRSRARPRRRGRRGRATRASTSAPMPPRGAKNTGRAGSATAARWARQASTRAARTAADGRVELRDRGRQAEPVGVAGVDAADQRVDQPLGGLVAELVAHERADGDVAVRRRRAGGGPADAAEPVAARGSPRPPARRGRSARPAPGPRGGGRSAPRLHTWARRAAGDTRSPSIPSSRHSSMPSGTRARKASAASSRTPPSKALRLHLAAEPSGLDERDRRRPAIAASRAATRPVMPPPTTTIAVMARRRGPGRPARRAPRGRR